MYILAVLIQKLASFLNDVVYRLRKWDEYLFDKRNKVNTRRCSKDFSHYSPTDIQLFRKCMKMIPISSKDIFADMGCGKGRCLIMATQYKFHKVIGVEYNETLFQILMHNIEVIKNTSLCQIEIYHENIKNYVINNDITVFYLNDPFDYYTFHGVMKKIKNSYEQHKRKIVLIYINLKADFEKCIIDTGIFKLSNHVEESTMQCKKCFGAHIFCTE